MKVIFLGTNGWYDTLSGNTLSILLESADCNIVLDAGNGFCKLEEYYDANKPVYLFLSHFHLDHIIGLHALAKYNFAQGLYIAGSKGIKNILSRIIQRPFTVSFEDLSFQTRFIEIGSGNTQFPFDVAALPLRHSDFCLGYRLAVDGKIVSFCTDTGYCENAVTLARNADLLIAECSYKPGQGDENWPHLNPETAARIAKEAEAKKLALVHFDARIYRRIEERKQAETVARALFKNTIAALDGLEIEL